MRMIRNHVHHIHHAIDEQPITIRAVITLVALFTLPIFGTVVRTVGRTLGLGKLVLPLLVLAHVPVVVALIAIWSIGCDLCRGGDST